MSEGPLCQPLHGSGRVLLPCGSFTSGAAVKHVENARLLSYFVENHYWNKRLIYTIKDHESPTLREDGELFLLKKKIKPCTAWWIMLVMGLFLLPPMLAHSQSRCLFTSQQLHLWIIHLTNRPVFKCICSVEAVAFRNWHNVSRWHFPLEECAGNAKLSIWRAMNHQAEADAGWERLTFSTYVSSWSFITGKSNNCSVPWRRSFKELLLVLWRVLRSVKVFGGTRDSSHVPAFPGFSPQRLVHHHTVANAYRTQNLVWFKIIRSCWEVLGPLLEVSSRGPFSWILCYQLWREIFWKQ